jgi:hypothetical protein
MLSLCLIASASAGITRQPYLQNVTQQGISIMWKTASLTASGTVHYGWTLGAYAQSVSSTNANGTHTARITGLSPGETFYYYVEADGDVVGQGDGNYRFTTAPAGDAPFRFCAYGDSRSNPDIHAAVVELISGYAPSFVIHTGDLTYDANAEEYDTDFFTPASLLLRNTPMFMSIGNHEYDPISNYYDAFDLPTNNPTETEAYYSFDYGPAHFVCLNSDMLPGGWESDPAKEAAQEAWLLADLSANTKPFTFVYFHRPPFTSSPGDVCQPALTEWVPIFEQYNVTMVFNGHTHCYDAYRYGHVYYVIAGGGGAMSYPCHTNPPYQIFDKFYYPMFGACVIDVSTDRVEMRAIDPNGTLHTIVAPGQYLWIEKENGIAGGVTAEPNLPAYPTGTQVTLTPTTGLGFRFDHWELYDPNHLHDANYAVVDANQSLTVTMDTEREVVAVFGCGSGAGSQLSLAAVGMLAAALVLRKVRG